MKKSFEVDDQLIMQQAKNYNNWLYGLVKPIIHGTSLEVGGGIGNLTKQILFNSRVRKHIVVDIDVNCLSLQQQCLQKTLPEIASKLELIHGDFTEVNFERGSLDIVICFNVLEHIENDQEAIKQMHELLAPGGYLVIFVPAFNFLFGGIDRKLKHFRRYDKAKLLHLLQEEKFREIKVRYFNVAGFLGWLLNFRILNRKRQNYNQVIIFDRYIFPIQSFIERFTPWQPIGQNLFALARK